MTVALARQIPAAVGPPETTSTTMPETVVDVPIQQAPLVGAVRRAPVTRLPSTRRPPIDDALFTLEVPRLGLLAKVHDGQSLPVLARGPGHLPDSALPGEAGNVVIPGHRTLAPHPFLDIDELQKGDLIFLETPGQRFVYDVTGTAIVSPDDTSVTDPTPDPTLTLYACHPKGSDRERYVVFARLVSSPAQRRAPAPQPKPAAPSPDAAPPAPSCGLVPCIRR